MELFGRTVLFFIVIVELIVAQDGYHRNIPLNQLGYNPFGHYVDDSIHGDEIPGEAGRDYPVYTRIPNTGFNCNNQRYPGYYADPEARCQVFHICQESGKGASFLCPNGTIFNQQFLVCDWWYNFDCRLALQYYNVNESIVRAMQAAENRLKKEKLGYGKENSYSGFDRQYSGNGGVDDSGSIQNNYDTPDKLYLPS